MHQPAKMAAPVLEGDKPWERGFAQIIGNCVNYDSEDRIYKMWYDTYKVTGGLIAYATSQDGLHWEKPDLGIVEVAGSRDNNIVLPGRNANVV
ncbi:MAG: hypothetical protein FJ319_13955, partial [SAR202 cluster bacterium]|nr:hypothetical protein [SAR202 cluster bacterium]